MTRSVGLAQLMAIIVVFAGGLAAMKSATVGLSRGVLYSAVLALLVATVGVLLRPRRGRGTWLGLVVFGWGYALFVLPIPQLNGGRNISTGRDDLTDLWRVDGPALELATLFHPRLPDPVDPDPDGKVKFDLATNLGTRTTPAGEVPLTPGEVKLHAEYHAQGERYRERMRLIDRTQVIALTLQGVAFALAGASVGHLMTKEPADGSTSRAEPGPTPILPL